MGGFWIDLGRGLNGDTVGKDRMVSYKRRDDGACEVEQKIQGSIKSKGR